MAHPKHRGGPRRFTDIRALKGLVAGGIREYVFGQREIVEEPESGAAHWILLLAASLSDQPGDSW